MPGVLTKKQCWRRQNLCARRRQHDLIYKEGFAKDIRYASGTRSFSDQSFSPGPPLVHTGLKPWATTGNLQEHKHDLFGNKLKSVMFSARVHVILIPSINEYEAAGLANQLWWEDEDYKDFKQSALQEVKDYMILRSISDSKEAIKILYQNMESNDLEIVSSAKERESSSNKDNGQAEKTTPLISESNGQSAVAKTDRKEGLRSFGFMNRSHSFCAKSSPSLLVEKAAGEPEITTFRSKTDVDIIHDKSTEHESQEFLKRLRKLHQQRLSKETLNMREQLSV